jgi:hypothetical protein
MLDFADRFDHERIAGVPVDPDELSIVRLVHVIAQVASIASVNSHTQPRNSERVPTSIGQPAAALGLHPTQFVAEDVAVRELPHFVALPGMPPFAVSAHRSVTRNASVRKDVDSCTSLDI